MALHRTVIIGIGMLAIWIAMLARVAYIQTFEAKHYRKLSEMQSLRRVILSPKRGEILDRNGEPLVINAELSVQADTASGGKMLHLRRVCPLEGLAGQVLGMVGRDGYGLLGLEYALDRELRGTDGWNYARQDVRHRIYPAFQEQKREPINGLSARLTLDTEMQRITEHALVRGCERTKAKTGIVMVVDPQTGDILALANYPFFNPNSYRGFKDRAWRNNAVGFVYEPGSTFKMVTASALIEENLIKTTDTIDAGNGTFALFGETIRDSRAHGKITFEEAMAYSSNISFSKAGVRLKPENFYRYARSFGFGIRTGIGLPAEEGGVLKVVGQWSGRTQATMAFGHEVSATPLQMAMAFCVIANGGLLMKPRILDAWCNQSGQVVESVPPRVVRRVISEATANSVRGSLKAVVKYGTAKKIYSENIEFAGKTGTAEIIDPVTGRYIKDKFRSSFIGMAPADKPKFVCLVLLDDPEIEKHGGDAAAPIFKEVMDRLLSRPEYHLASLKNSVSNSPDSLSVPDLTGYPLKDVERILKGVSLSTNMKGNGEFVLEQFPKSGTKVLANSSITLTVGGLSSLKMPDVTQLSLRDAMLKLKGLGLKINYSGTGRVFQQKPQIGEKIEPGQACHLALGWES